MRVLLDTHTFIWWDDDELPRRVTKLIRDADMVFVSAATAWEMAIKSALGKLVMRGTVTEALVDYGFSPLPVFTQHADAVRMLPTLHRDPFDRLLIAQAQVEGLTIVTRDQVFARYDVPVWW